MSEGEFHLDDYVNYVQEFIRHLQSTYGNCHVMSVCQPTVPVLAAVSLMASRGEVTPLSMTMMGGPIDARKSPTAVNNLAMNKSHSWFENNVIYRVPSSFPGVGRRVYPGFLQHSGFVAMNPSNHAKSHYDYFQDLIKGDGASTEAHSKFYDEYNAVLDMDADYYLDTIVSYSRTSASSTEPGMCVASTARSNGCAPRTSRRRRCSRSRANSTTYRVPARPRPCTGSAAVSSATCRNTTKSRAPATTASSPGVAGARWCIRRSSPSSCSTREMSGTPTVPVAIDDKPAAPTVKRVRRKVTKHQA
jgi:hypothetical protein